MRYTLIILFVVSCIPGHAQKTAMQYSGLMEAGVTNGSFETNAFINTAHGIKVNGWFGGIGTGVDYYRFRTIPLFLVARKELTRKDIRPFVELSVGKNLNWLTQEQKDHRVGWWQQEASTFSNGYYYKIGSGVLFNKSNNIRFATTISWSYKSLTEKYSERIWEPWPQPNNNLTEKILEYKLNRINLGISVLF